MPLLAAGDDDDDLYESLARARKAAEKQQKQSATSLQDSLAERLASRRDQDEAQQAVQVPQSEGKHCPFPLSRSAWPALLLVAALHMQLNMHVAMSKNRLLDSHYQSCDASALP